MRDCLREGCGVGICGSGSGIMISCCGLHQLVVDWIAYNLAKSPFSAAKAPLAIARRIQGERAAAVVGWAGGEDILWLLDV